MGGEDKKESKKGEEKKDSKKGEGKKDSGKRRGDKKDFDHDTKDVSKDGRNRKDFKKSSESSSEDEELSFSELKHEGERKKEGEGHSVSKFDNAELSREDKKMKDGSEKKEKEGQNKGSKGHGKRGKGGRRGKGKDKDCDKKKNKDSEKETGRTYKGEKSGEEGSYHSYREFSSKDMKQEESKSEPNFQFILISAGAALLFCCMVSYFSFMYCGKTKVISTDWQGKEVDADDFVEVKIHVQPQDEIIAEILTTSTGEGEGTDTGLSLFKRTPEMKGTLEKVDGEKSMSVLVE